VLPHKPKTNRKHHKSAYVFDYQEVSKTRHTNGLPGDKYMPMFGRCKNIQKYKIINNGKLY
jgi:hypothetical protein